MSDEQANDFTITGPTFTEDGFTVGVIHLLTSRKAEYEYKLADERVRQGLIALGWTPPDAPPMTREEAMAKWGLIERPHIVMGDDYYDGDFTVVTVNGVAIDCHYGEGNSNDLEPTDRHLWGVTVVENLQRALGITEGGAQ